ncbi:hypothetical protein G6F50_016239 [Rhizopus delemar]|uniref:Uncharacterized protein n=1 Tax=Rhizopus delemar TaxID=936053 RepID=A0A9P6XUT0_9FUNG|nr:hypothetical protein G6F50_016239 [Rhizopus delemar]
MARATSRAPGGDSHRGRDLRQHRGILEPEGKAAAGPGTAGRLPPVLGRRTAGTAAAGALCRQPHRPGRRDRQEARVFQLALRGGLRRWRAGLADRQGRG